MMIILFQIQHTFVPLAVLYLCIQELSSFMEYVDKLATSAAETAYIGGAEHMSTIMCETLNSVHTKVNIFI
jgi:hypothetical protein